MRHRTGSLSVCCVLALFGCAAPSIEPRVEFTSVADEPFSEMAVKRGVKATYADCQTVRNGVWVVVGKESECLRYWYGGFDNDKAPQALFYFTEDILVNEPPQPKGVEVDPSKFSVPGYYTRTTPSAMQRRVDAVAKSRGVPYVILGRPGLYGSSGDHRQRRRALESQLISAAMDQIKKRHDIARIGIAGQSGGGHVVASLLTLRSDIACAVAASEPASPKLRWTMRGQSRDMTGYKDSFEPTEHIRASSATPGLRAFVLGDPQDANVPWQSQLVLATKLKEHGMAVQVLEGEGTGPERHNLSGSSVLIASMCMKGASTESILNRAREGLKG